MIARGSVGQVMAPPHPAGALRAFARLWRMFADMSHQDIHGIHDTADEPASSSGNQIIERPTVRPALRLHVAQPDSDYDAFIREHQRTILNYLWRMMGDEQSAYDLTQEVFVRAWRHFEKLRDYTSPRAWLFRVATNLAISALRGKRTLSSVDLLPTEQQPASSDPAWRVVERDLVRAALDTLPPRRRAVLTLREVYGLTCAEVARALGISEAAARMTLSRAREQFRDAYLREGGDGHDA